MPRAGLGRRGAASAALFVGRTLGLRSQELSGLLLLGDLPRVSTQRSTATFAGGDVALFCPGFHFALISVVGLSGICVKNRCDIGGKMYSVCVICVIPCQEMCFELYCSLRDVLIKTLHFLLLSVAFIPSPTRVPSVPRLPHVGRGARTIPQWTGVVLRPPRPTRSGQLLP